MKRRGWSSLNPWLRRLIVVAGILETGLKVVALVDLARRPEAQVRGSKVVWAVAIATVNSFGTIPLAYFRRGRREG